MDGRVPRILAVLVGIAAVAVVLALVLGGDDSDDEDKAQQREFNTTVTTIAIENAPTADVVGLLEGEPFERMSLDIRRTVTVAPMPGGRPVPFQSDMTMSNAEGSVFVKLVGTARVNRQGESSEKGNAEISGGTGEYEGITGSFTIAGNSEPGAFSHLKGRGSVTY